MEQIASDARRAFFLRVLAPGEPLDPPFDSESYPVLLWATQPTSPEQKQRIAEALMASGCRYVVCGGVEFDAWEEAADEAFVAQDLSDAAFAERHVMTTSHRGEREGEVAHFFVHNANFGAHDFKRYLVLMIGSEEDGPARVVDAVRNEVESPV